MFGSFKQGKRLVQMMTPFANRQQSAAATRSMCHTPGRLQDVRTRRPIPAPPHYPKKPHCNTQARPKATPRQAKAMRSGRQTGPGGSADTGLPHAVPETLCDTLRAAWETTFHALCQPLGCRPRRRHRRPTNKTCVPFLMLVIWEYIPCPCPPQQHNTPKIRP